MQKILQLHKHHGWDVYFAIEYGHFPNQLSRRLRVRIDKILSQHFESAFEPIANYNCPLVGRVETGFQNQIQAPKPRARIMRYECATRGQSLSLSCFTQVAN